MAVPLRSWKRRFLNPSRRARFAKMFVTLAGWPKVVKEKPSPSRGVPGKIRLPSGNLINERSIVAPSGTPAAICGCCSRIASGSESSSSSMLMTGHCGVSLALSHRPPRKLTQGELARLLRPFGIRPKTIWPAQRRPGDKSRRGYGRAQFAAAHGVPTAEPTRRHNHISSTTYRRPDPTPFLARILPARNY